MPILAWIEPITPPQGTLPPTIGGGPVIPPGSPGAPPHPEHPIPPTVGGGPIVPPTTPPTTPPTAPPPETGRALAGGGGVAALSLVYTSTRSIAASALTAPFALAI